MSWLRQVFSRRRLYNELSDEIRSHLEEKTEELVAKGLSRADAATEARRAFGNVTQVQETGRAVWEWPTLDSFVLDVRYAVRQLRRTPAITAAAVLTLAIGIAANATVFSWTRAVFLDPLPGAAASSRVVALEEMTASDEWTPTSYLDFRDLEGRATSLESMAVAYPTGLVVGDDASAERRLGEIVSGRFFDLLGVRPERGRFFSASEADGGVGSAPVVVISHSLWVSRYQADSAVIGKTIRINRYPFTVIGVAPRNFRGSLPGSARELWVLATMFGQLDPNGRSFLRDRKTRMFRVLGRLAPGATVTQARVEVRSIASRLAELNPASSQGMSATVLPMWQSHYGIQDSLRAPLGVLTGACGVMLLIVCANMALLLLTRAASRRKEFSLRLALGAPRARVVRQLLTEAAVLTVAGSVLGLIGAAWLSGSLPWLVPAFSAPGLLRPRVDSGVLAFTVALACGVTILAGIAPAMHGARENLSDALNSVGRGTTGGAGAKRMGRTLVMCEMALAVVSLVGAGLFLRSFQRVRAVEPGFDAQGVAVGAVSLSTAGYGGAHADAFLRGVRERLERQPAVSAVSYSDYVPLSVAAGSWEDLQIEGYAPTPSENMKLYRTIVAPGYFGLMKIAIQQGRDFTLLDDSAHGPAMIVNEEFVRRYFRGPSAIGRKVRGWGKWFTIVGVVRDSKINRLSEKPAPYFYVSMRQIYRPEFAFTFFVRTSRSIDDAIAAIGREVRAGDPAIPVFNLMPLSEYVAAPLSEQKVAATLLSIVAGIAFLLAAIGLYGVMADAVAQRTKEIGVRLAMGAQRSDVWRMIMRQAAVLLAAGVAAGLAGAAALSRFVSAMLFGVRAGDPVVYLAAAGCMVVIAIVATGVPARRAMLVDPMIALRGE